MLTLKKVKEMVKAPVHTKRVPSPKVLLEDGRILLRKEFEHDSHLTLYHSGYVLFSAGKRNTVFHIHDCCGDYAYDAAEGKGDVIEEEYFENCEWHIRALFEGERKMEDNQAKCKGAGRSNVCVSYHALSEDWSEIADRTMAFEYDDNKNQINIKKHGISFKSAARIFFDYDRIEFYDEDHSYDEDRYNTIGDTSAGRISQKAEGALIGNIDQFIGKVNEILFVVYTERVRIEESGTKTDVTRLISARMATEFERGLYYGKNE